MSSYINFFVKSKSNELCPIGDFSRNTVLYRTFEHIVPFGKVISIAKQTILDVKEELKTQREAEEVVLKENEELLNKISTFNNPIEEKISAIYDQQDVINDIKDSIYEIKYAYNYVTALLEIVDTQPVENENNYIYAGIEVPRDYSINNEN